MTTEPVPVPGYRFTAGQRCILAEVYLPFRLSTQGVLFDTLRNGLSIDTVRTYLTDKAAAIRNELAVYPHWFDPSRYGDTTEYQSNEARAIARLEQVEQVFYGWSYYEVNGVFLAENGRIDQERTQVVRLIFRYGDEMFADTGNNPVLIDAARAMQYWFLSAYGHTSDNLRRGSAERTQFLSRHPTFTIEQITYVHAHWDNLAQRVTKWIDDAGLFIFGYLTRNFCGQVMRLKDTEGEKTEDEIWVTSIFHLNVNVLYPLKKDENDDTLTADQSNQIGDHS